MEKITKNQQRCLDKMELGQKYCSYRLGESLNTLFALEKRGMVKRITRVGSGWSPTTDIDWIKIKGESQK